ncbi:MAG: VCBS repeat-containing protein [Candidatus Omnitrophica bacterium]|nr:VCBS repeat-containing protein [Candidatus Omnitrophota bacterium]
MKVWALIAALLVVSIPSANAYYKKYPPYLLKQGPPKTVKARELTLKETPAFVKKNSDLSDPSQIYAFDIDGNGLEDYIVILHPGASELSGQLHIYLQKKKGLFQKISVARDVYAGIEDFVDVNNDGKYEVIIADVYESKRHNYFAYSIYEFKDGKLANADKKFRGFPKFVWMTDKPNDKNTARLSAKVQQDHVAKKSAAIKYHTVKITSK